jgi:LuxR family maltose regulon positive regulatory protein
MEDVESMSSPAPLPAIETEAAPPPHHRLLTTKLWPPRLRANLVDRPRLVKALDQTEAALIVIAASAGYGKSILVRQWLIGADLASAWVSLDPYDNDPLDFFMLIVAALQSIDVDLAPATQKLLNGMSPPSGPAIVGSLVAELFPATRPLVLVLDDYHVIDNPEIHDAMAALLLQLPPGMRVVLVSRTDPPLPLARLRSQQDIFELGQEDLRITGEEAVELMRQGDRLEVTPNQAINLNARAEGWVAGLQLVGHVLRGQPPQRIHRFATEFTGSVRSIESYLWEEVIGRQAEAVRTFLLRTSILDRFCGSLCQAVTGSPDSGAIIRQLEQDHLFVIALDDRGQWYRYHHLFAEALRDRLAQAEGESELADLHRRAAAWLEPHEFIEEASRHALAGRDWDRAERLLERISTEHYEQERLASLCALLQDVPAEALERSPTLAFRFAWALIRSGQFQQAEQPLRIAERAWATAGDRNDLASLLILQAYRSMYDSASRVIDLCGQALELLSDDRPMDQGIALALLGWAHMHAGDPSAAERAFAGARARANVVQDTLIHVSELAGSASVLVQRGKLREAIAMFRRAIRLDERYASTLLSYVYIERNQLDEAERHLRVAEAAQAQPRPLILQSRIWRGLAQLAWAKGDFETAHNDVEWAIDYARQLGSTRFVRHARAQQARFWLAEGRRDLALRWAESCELDPYFPPDYERFFEHLTIVRLLIDGGQAGSALKILDAIGEQAAAQGRAGDLVEIQVLEALAHQREGNPTRALDALDRALTLGNAGGYMRVFINEGEAIVPLLRGTVGRGAHGGYAPRLLAATEGAVTLATEARADRIDILSKREVEVLRLVADGLSNRDVGQHLFISESTVKRHLSTIYEKLAVNSRTQAIDHARRAGLV